MKTFIAALAPGLFQGMPNARQIAGMNIILKATEGLPIRHRAYLLSTTLHETARTMEPIHERGGHAYFDKYEPNTRIGKRLGNTRRGDGFLFRGRGYVQITGRANYLRASQELGVDLVAHPDRALEPEIAARILVKGCTEGWFTGKSLDDYDSYTDMRRVVNGTDRAAQIADYARDFEAALVAMDKPPVKAPRRGFWDMLWAFIQR